MFTMSDLMQRQKRERREHILAATRELLAERGYADVTVRELAERCGVSVPTLYNRFGGKDGLIAEAVRERFAEVLAADREAGEPAGHARLMGLVGRIADGIVELADYHRALLLAFTETRESGDLQHGLATELVSAISEQLAELRARRRLADWVAPEVLAAQIATACISASVTWAVGAVSDRGLRPFMEHSVGLLLVASTRGAARQALLERVQDAQERVAPEILAPAAAEGIGRSRSA